MSSVPAVVVKKGGFLNGLFYGFFGFLITTVICATSLGIYGMRIADNKFEQVWSLGDRLLEVLPQWQAALPPALADAISDRRAPDYSEQVDVTARLVSRRGHGRFQNHRAVLEVTNNGTETISLLAVRVVLLDEDGVPVDQPIAYVATPMAIEDDWPGPLLPGTTRPFAVWVHAPDDADYTVAHEITELRVWQPGVASDVPIAESVPPEQAEAPAARGDG